MGKLRGCVFVRKKGIGSKCGSKGISPLIASVLSIMLGVMMLAIVLTVIQPTFKSARDSSTIADIFQNLRLIDSAIKEVSSEAQGSKRTISLTVSGGEYRINSTYDWIYATYEPESDLRLVGRRGDIRIDRGLVYAEFFNWFPEGSTGEPEWTNTSGQWSVSSLRYVGTNGTSYINITPRPIESFEFSGGITNVSGETGGQIFVLPRPPNELRAFWAFDNKSENKSYDYSGYQNNGNLTNMNITGNSTSGWQNDSICKVGPNCLMFDGVNDYIDHGAGIFPSVKSNFTMELWVYPLSARETTAEATTGISGNTGNQRYAIYPPPAHVEYSSSDAGAGISVGTNGISVFEHAGGYMPSLLVYDTTLSGWHHVVVVYESKQPKLYLDGVLVRTGLTSTKQYIYPGQDLGETGGTYGYFHGYIDEVKIWNVSLSAEEVAAEYELSNKKLWTTGSHSVSAKTYGSLVLSNPAGQTQFDNIKISRGALSRLSFLIPYSRVDINGTLSIEKGEYLVEIAHRGVNTTSNKPIIEITAV